MDVAIGGQAMDGSLAVCATRSIYGIVNIVEVDDFKLEGTTVLVPSCTVQDILA